MTIHDDNLLAKMAADIAVRKEVEQEEGDEIVAKEKALIAGGDEKAKAKRWCGIALSGGGIRSSTFCTGILQALASQDEDRLKSFDYISTVSGGGFIGSSLRWWWHGIHGVKDQAEKDVAFGTGPKDFPYGTSDPRDPNSGDTEEQKANLGYLRNHGYYLTPGNGITLWSGLAVVIRTILLNLLVWIPIATGLFYFFWWWRADWTIFSWIFTYLPNGGSPLPEALICPRWDVSTGGMVTDHIRLLSETVACTDGQPLGFHNVLTLPPLFAVLIWLSYAFLAVFLIGSLFYSIQTGQTTGAGGAEFTRSHLYWMAFAIGLILIAIAIFSLSGDWNNGWLWAKGFALGLIFFAFAIIARMVIILIRNFLEDGKEHGDRSENRRTMSQAYYLRRFFELSVSFCFKYFLVFLIFGFVPVVFNVTFTLTSSPGLAGLFSLAVGVAAALTAHAQTFRTVAPGAVEKVFLPIGSGLFLFGVIVLSYQIAMLLIEVGILVVRIDSGTSSQGKIALGTEFAIVSTNFAELVFDKISDKAGYALSLLIAFLVLIAFAMAKFVNTNQISLNRFYRDRLMEAYMPHAEAVKAGEAQPTPADALELHELWKDGPAGSGKDKFIGPYPLINTNCVLVNDDVQKIRIRGGDNYLLSPLYCGSTATSWFETKSDACKMLTLPTAMATSGAAANPNSGYIGTGPTRERLLSIVMMLLNIRLGLWVVNPGLSWFLDKLPRPNHLRPGGQYAVTNRGFRRDSPFLELSDGGHFDNSGLYELIRRKCEVIVACDGEADKDFGFSSFVSLQRRIAEDFGVEFKFHDQRYWPRNTIPSKKLAYPKDALYADLPFFVAKIVYSQSGADQETPKDGILIYIKSTMIDDLSFATKGYKAKNPDFPHETTADQFFDPQQFEVYRELGYYAAKLMMDHVDEDWKPRAEPRRRKMDIEALADMPVD